MFINDSSMIFVQIQNIIIIVKDQIIQIILSVKYDSYSLLTL